MGGRGAPRLLQSSNFLRGRFGRGTVLLLRLACGDADARSLPFGTLLYIATLAGCDAAAKKPDSDATEPERSLGLREAPVAAGARANLDGAAIDGSARAALSDEVRGRVDASRLPILLPRRLAGQGRLLTEEHWYDFAYRGNGLRFISRAWACSIAMCRSHAPTKQWLAESSS